MIGMQQTSQAVDQEIARQVLAAIKAIRFGSVEIVIHDSTVVQIERREKVRFSVESKPNR